jgi:hypothetical protein
MSRPSSILMSVARRPFSFAVSILLLSCGGSQTNPAAGILTDPGLSAARKALADAPDSADPNFAACKEMPSSTAGWSSAAFGYDESLTTSSCRVDASSDPSQVGQSCEVMLQIASNGNSTMVQLGQGGSGQLYVFLGAVVNGMSTEQLIVQDTTTGDAGCSQETYDEIVIDQSWRYCSLTYIKTSTCGDVGSWKASAGIMGHAQTSP